MTTVLFVGQPLWSAAGRAPAVCGFGAQPAPVAKTAAPPVLAYFYQWFTPSSWATRKLDSPLIGKYSSDDTAVMCDQVALAQGAGIDGFIVSWKVQGPNDARLHALVRVASALHFKLAIIYQGLDRQRRPQPADRVAHDLAEFRSNYGRDPVFRIFGAKPLVIWSGTPSYSVGDIAGVTTPLRRDMTILGYAQSVTEYERTARYFDGNAYYWSSGNPRSTKGYAERLVGLGAAVHKDHGLWIAPFAPGFDARKVCFPQPGDAPDKCGSITVPRNDGATMRAGYASAVRSEPDALGLISWNEFSENTYIEPSKKLGLRYLGVLRDLRGITTGPSAAEYRLAAQAGVKVDDGFDSDSPDGRSWAGPVAIAVAVPAFLAFAVFLRRRGRRSERSVKTPSVSGDGGRHRDEPS